MEQVQILWVARSFANSSSGVKTHSHPYYHMFYVPTGEIRFTVHGEEYLLPAGHCLLVPKNTEHAYLNEGTTPAGYLEIKFSLPAMPLDAQFAHAGVLHTGNALAGLLFEQIVNEYSQLGSLADDAAAAYLLALLNVLTKAERCRRPRRFRFIDGSEFSALAQRIILYLEEHYTQAVSLDELAAALGHNKSYLCIAFKKNTRITIVDCLNMIRIRRAAELITYSDHSLTQVASLCGFASVSHFNRVFLKYAGITPGQCRRAYPFDVLFGPEDRRAEPSDASNRFMYSVLAQKRITPEMIRDFDQKERLSAGGGAAAAKDAAAGDK